MPFERSASPSGRPVIALLQDVSLQEQMRGTDQQQYRAKRADDCGLLELNIPTAGEDHALTALNDAVDACLRRQKLPEVELGPDIMSGTAAARGDVPLSARNCVDTGRREQLAPYVAPSALLYVSDTSGSSAAPFDLSPANAPRTLVVTAVVLLLGAFVTVVTGVHLVRPLRALTRAAQGRDEDLPRCRSPGTTRSAGSRRRSTNCPSTGRVPNGNARSWSATSPTNCALRWAPSAAPWRRLRTASSRRTST
ncbi:hypothetical protein [Streptomyces sp. NPDC017991]|uniref:hypothetical protein n=1 Tax=Streptomyces sp. NPDC017991 TaxID=3365026 RepID=UPI0037B10821